MNDSQFLRRLAADKRKEAKRTDNDIDRNCLEDEAVRLDSIAERLMRYETLAIVLRRTVMEASE